MKLSKKEKAIILEALLWMVHGDTDGWDNATKDLAKKLLVCQFELALLPVLDRIEIVRFENT